MSEIKAVEGVKLDKKQDKPSLFKTFVKGLWTNNPGLCQLLGLCPLLAVTTSAVSALGLALATLLVLCISSVIISLIRKLIYREVRIPIYVLLIATLVTVVQFYIQAYFPSLYEQLGIYLSLIVTNCIIMGRAEAFAAHNSPLSSFIDALGSGIGFSFVLFILGALREIIGAGTLFFGASNILGDFGAALEWQIIDANHTLMIAILPPGGFILLAFMIAFKNYQNTRKQKIFNQKFEIKSLQK